MQRLRGSTRVTSRLGRALIVLGLLSYHLLLYFVFQTYSNVNSAATSMGRGPTETVRQTPQALVGSTSLLSNLQAPNGNNNTSSSNGVKQEVQPEVKVPPTATVPEPSLADRAQTFVKCTYGVGIPTTPRSNKVTGAPIEYWKEVIDAVPAEVNVLTVLSRFPTPEKNREIEEYLKAKAKVNKHLTARLVFPAPQKEAQPDFDTDLIKRPIKQNYGDSMERVLWRSSLTLDFVRLVRFTLEQCDYVLWIEDDAILLDGWLDMVKSVTPKHNDWTYKWLTEWGSMGVLVNSKHALNMIQYLTHHFDEMPVDWNLEHWERYYRKKFPNIEGSQRLRIVGHKGTVSSLKEADVRPTIDASTLMRSPKVPRT